MAKFTEFADLLVSKIQSANVPPLSPTQSEFDSDPAHLSFLLGQMHATFRSAPITNPYFKMRMTPVPHALSEMQQKALAQWQSWGMTLSPGFRPPELKKAFRTLAKRLHPDTSGRTGVEFIALKESYKELSKLFA